MRFLRRTWIETVTEGVVFVVEGSPLARMLKILKH